MSKWLFEEMGEPEEPKEPAEPEDSTAKLSAGADSSEFGGPSKGTPRKRAGGTKGVARKRTRKTLGATVPATPRGIAPQSITLQNIQGIGTQEATPREMATREMEPLNSSQMDIGKEVAPNKLGDTAGVSTGDLTKESAENAAWTVSQLTARIRTTLDTTFRRVTVVGEISDLSRPGSGHAYFTLKDSESQISGVIWRGILQRLPFELSDGLSIVCQGRLEVYAARGKYQLVIDSLRPEGLGPLELAYRQLFRKLSREGLFENYRKRAIPRSIRRVAVVTSPTGAAIHDFLNVLRRRGRRDLAITVVPVRVQGTGASQEIAAAIELVNRISRPAFDVIVVTRGGGSLDDLWSFNEECVVRAIVSSRIPVVSGVGHEIDVTLTDLAADLRALTPSEAAQKLAPDAEKLEENLRQYQSRLTGTLRQRTAVLRRILEEMATRSCFRDPMRRVREAEQRLDELDGRAARAIRRRTELAKRELTMAGAHLESVSPLAILGRGFSLTRTLEGRVVRDLTGLTTGMTLMTRLAQGEIRSRIEEIREK